tara:strand:+ start:573 stop:695 length:123 start_codon:yes stop_codon:yes gene_type:complete
MKKEFVVGALEALIYFVASETSSCLIRAMCAYQLKIGNRP